MSKAVAAPGVTAAARAAKEQGLKRFPWSCSLHGEQEFYTGSHACPQCTVDRKNKDLQREYNRAVAEKYPHVRREDGSWTRKKA